MKPIYLDYAAATPMASEVKAAMLPYLDEHFFNPSAQYLAAKAVAGDLADARASIARWIGCRPSEIIFTAGGTEANNLAIHGVLGQYPEGRVLYSAIEHESVSKPAQKHLHGEVSVTADGIVNVDALRKAIDDKTVLVSIMYANNEIGTVQPLKQVASVVAEVRRDRQKRGKTLPLYLHTDACQAGAYLDLHANRLGVDLMTINAGKIYGPKQCGALYVRSGIQLTAQIVGGGQERGQRSGTENVANVIGFAAALGLVQARRHDEVKRLLGLQKHFLDLLQKKIPQIVINGSLKHRLPNNVHITIPGTDNERLMMELDERGIQCAAGSACSASNEEPSHVLRAIGLSDEYAQASLRFSMGHNTTITDIKRTVEALSSVVKA